LLERRHDCASAPFIGQVVTATFHPQTLLSLVLGAPQAPQLNGLFAYLAAGAGAYRMARGLCCARVAAVSGGVSLIASGYLLGMSNNLPYLVGLATLPWVGSSALSLSRQQRATDVAALSIAAALVFPLGRRAVVPLRAARGAGRTDASPRASTSTSASRRTEAATLGARPSTPLRLCDRARSSPGTRTRAVTTTLPGSSPKHASDTTKGKKAVVLPIPKLLQPFLEHAVQSAPGPFVFPAGGRNPAPREHQHGEGLAPHPGPRRYHRGAPPHVPALGGAKAARDA
jgi:hypothetical protein